MKPLTGMVLFLEIIILLLLAFCSFKCASIDDHNPCTNVRVPCLLYPIDGYIQFQQFEWECNQAEYLYSDGENFKLNTWLMDENGLCHEVWLIGWVDSCNEGTTHTLIYVKTNLTLIAKGEIFICDDILWWSIEYEWRSPKSRKSNNHLDIPLLYMRSGNCVGGLDFVEMRKFSTKEFRGIRFEIGILAYGRTIW